MTPERLRQIEEIYHSARERKPGERGAFLAGACQHDDEVRREVESLLAQESADAIMERPAMEVAANLLADATVTRLATGSQLGPYRIEAPLGAGGMGEVYRARDTRLGRSVAIKVCTAQFSGRFEREARAISALNHPNICTLHDVGSNYLVMELVEGETLSARLRKGSLSIDLVLRYGAQVADALAAAHARGITHRDLKPGNIMIAKAGVKVLDFGLAKFTRPADAALHSETLTAEQVVGTLAYMAPEQLEGKECDARSDIFSLGLVLYEMVTGRRVFEGDSQAALMASVMRCEPAPLVGVSERLSHVVERCLNRDPDSRWHSAADVKLELEWAAKPTSAATEQLQATSRAPKRWLWPSIAAVMTTAALAVTVGWLREPAPLDLSAYRYTPFAFSQHRDEGGSWSPDGKTIAFFRDDNLMVQPSDGGVPTQLVERVNATDIAWSPDGNRVYFNGFGGGVHIVSRAGGQPELVLAGPPDRLTYFDVSPDGKALAVWRALKGQDGSVRSSVWISSPPGAEPREYTPARSGFYRVWLRFSPDGKLLFLSTNTERGVETWLLPFPAGSGSPRRLFRGASWEFAPQASWMPDARRLVLGGVIGPRGGGSSLWLADVRDESLTKLAPESREGSGEGYPAVSPDGRRLLFTGVEGGSGDIVELPLDGSPFRKLLAGGLLAKMPAWSPKGGQFAYVTRRNTAMELWIRSSQGDWERPVVTAKEIPGLGVAGEAVFSPDGARIVYSANIRGVARTTNLYVSAQAGGTPTLVIEGGQGPSWSPDGASIAFQWTKPNGRVVLATLRVGSNQPPFEMPDVAIVGKPLWSPSGEWIACATTNMGPVLVSPADGKVKRQLPRLGASALAWSKDSGTIYGMTRPNGVAGHPTLVALDVRTKMVRKVADYDPELHEFGGVMSLSPDGKSVAIGTFNEQSHLWILEGFAK